MSETGELNGAKFLTGYFPHMEWEPSESEKSEISDGYPECPVPVFPCGERVLLQIRVPKKKTKGGIYIAETARDTEKWNEQNAKIIAWGPLAFRNRTTLEPWPDYNSYKVGAFVRIPLYGGDKIEVPISKNDDGAMEFALFVIRKDFEIISRVVGNPVDVKTCF